MRLKTFRSIVEKYPLNLLYESAEAEEYQYIHPELCRFLIVKFSKKHNYIEVPYKFAYRKKQNHIVPIDRNNKEAISFFAYKHISNPSEQEVHTELTRIIKQIKQVQYKAKLDKIQKDF